MRWGLFKMQTLRAPPPKVLNLCVWDRTSTFLTVPQIDSTTDESLRNRAYRIASKPQTRLKPALHPQDFPVSPSSSNAGSRGSSFYPLGLLTRSVGWLCLLTPKGLIPGKADARRCDFHGVVVKLTDS